jgi:hypothetical protein
MTGSSVHSIPDFRLGRATSSPPQFGQRPCMEAAHLAQNVHSKLQMRASAESPGSGAKHFSQAGLRASAIAISSR